MEIVEQAIETTATIDPERGLVLDEPLPVAGPKRVRVIILLPLEDDPDEREWLRAARKSPAFDFLDHPEENVYSLADGSPFHDQG